MCLVRGDMNLWLFRYCEARSNPNALAITHSSKIASCLAMTNDVLTSTPKR